MGRPPSRHPTAYELEILKIVWRDGQTTSRQIQEELGQHRKRAYTSVATVMTIMVRKGYLERININGTNVYKAKIGKSSITGRILRDIIERVFGGSSLSLMLNVLKDHDLDADEIKQLRAIIDEKKKD